MTLADPSTGAGGSDGDGTEQLPVIADPWLDEPRTVVIEGELAAQIAAVVRSRRCFAFTDHAHRGEHFDWQAPQWERFAGWGAAAAAHFSLDNWVLLVEVIAEGAIGGGPCCRVRAVLATRSR